MVRFDATKFLNFYGFTPNVFNNSKKKKLPVLKGEDDSDNRPASRHISIQAAPDRPLLSHLTLIGVLTANEGTKRNYTFDIPPVITVNLKKNIITTKVAGSSRKPIVEIIGHDTFKIKIQGYIDNSNITSIQPESANLEEERDDSAAQQQAGSLENEINEPQVPAEIALRDDRFPLEKLRTLYQIFSKNEAISVKSDLLDTFGISRIVMTDMPDITYYPTAFTYTFNAIADEHQEILVLEK